MNDKSSAVAEIRPGTLVREPQQTTLGDIARMAEAVAKSGLFGVKTPEQAMALMLIAQAEGLHPAIAARDYDIIQGRPAKKSEAMLRSFIANGGRVKWIALNDVCAEATFSHAQGGEITIRWDIARATTAGLTSKDMYKKYPRQMLRARCISEGVRTVCPMATSGMYVPEEIIDVEPVAVEDNTALTAEQATELREIVTSTGSDESRFLAYLNENYKLALTKLEELPARLLEDAKKILANAAAARARTKAQP